MKELSFEKMEEVNGGLTNCTYAMIGVGFGFLGFLGTGGTIGAIGLAWAGYEFMRNCAGTAYGTSW